jgi:glyoxylase-like metal-dependent hydrolase (beta-lactamase superfamily II)
MMTIGKASIKRLVDIETFAMPLSIILPQADLASLEPHRDLLAPDHIDFDAQAVLLTVQSHIVQVDGLTILVDTCVGEEKHRPLRPVWHQRKQTGYLERLAGLVLRPEDIDMVMCTHLHPDHVGWNTRLSNGKWVPTFPNAKYVMGKVEFEHWHALAQTQLDPPVNQGSFADSVLPIIERQQEQFVGVGDGLAAGLSIIDLEGHTKGQIGLDIDGGTGTRAIICGDAVHTPAQVLFPQWSSAFCLDGAAAAQTRQRLFTCAASEDVVLVPNHLRGEGMRIEAKGHGFMPRFCNC